MSFALDPRLAKDTLTVGDLALSRVLLMNDARWPWLILAPRRENLVELADLEPPDRARLIEEAAAAGAFLKAHAKADKINVGALGNIVRQFHLHVVARAPGDPAWPGLSSDAKCNTPRRFGIGKVVQDLKECCSAILFASVGGRKRPDRRFAGRGAVDGGHCPCARSGENHHLQRAAAERTPLGRVFAASRRGSLSTAQAA
jgi:diadenosine tetraphosphate (Ap4A) HIT family hydrolase